jgi:methyltransferase-like protein/ubiquinone/menaquinone biosynthesis C-methylase UbiE
VANLFGLQPPPVGQCRVLELGCASGGNLIPMAYGLPGGHFVGVDLSHRQLAEGQRVVEALGLTNIELQHRSILDIGLDFGRFDYVVCHGVYSWVPAEVQDKILAICVRNLAPNGVAYVSYNTYPGWHLRGMIRDMMCYHAQRFAEPPVRTQQARALLDFLAQAVPGDQSAYSLLLRGELEFVRGKTDSYLFHEFLEEVNAPLYFYQFAERAAAHGLQYLGEAQLCAMVVSNFAPEVGNTLRLLSPDLIHLEQYMDFVRNRTFRQTLLCHRDVRLKHVLYPEDLAPLHVASPARPVATEPDLPSTAVEQFRGPDGTLSTPHPIVKAAMCYLAEIWPRAVPFATLGAVARSRLGGGPGPDAVAAARETQVLGTSLLECYTSPYQLVELHVAPPPLVAEVGERPVASALARFQAAAGATVTNLRHEIVGLSELSRHVLRYLDGSRDRAALLDALAELAARDILVVQHQGQPVKEVEKARAFLGESLDQSLRELARHALLVG